MAHPEHAPPPHDLPILIVDDARFTLEMHQRALKSAGYRDVRATTRADDALEMIKRRKPAILLLDWLMPDTDGLSLTALVRQFDEENNHYTYIILCTAKEELASLNEAFEHGVDDFIVKSPDSTELLARIRAAGRIALMQNDLLTANNRLLELDRRREQRSSFDAVTGLGNAAYLERQTEELLRYVEGRGGTACCAVVELEGLEALQGRYGNSLVVEVLDITATRLKQSIRPLDVVARIGADRFALLMLIGQHGTAHPHAFRRIYQSLNLRAYKTTVGFLNVGAVIAMTAVRRSGGSGPDAASVVRFTCEQLPQAREAGRVHLVPWPETTSS